MISSYVSKTKAFDHFYKFMAAGGHCFLGKEEYRIGNNGFVQRLNLDKDGNSLFQDIDVAPFRTVSLAEQVDKLFLRGASYSSQPNPKSEFLKGELIILKGGDPKDSWWITDIISGVYFLKSDRSMANQGLYARLGYIDVDIADETFRLDNQFQMRRDLDAIINGDD